MEKNIRVLIVEDEFFTLDMLRDYLEESGYKVSGDAMSAEEAITILEEGQTDLALLDISIKGNHDGIWLAEQINKKYRIPFVFLTAFSDSQTVRSAAKTNPYGYLVKPFSQADIFTSIEIALNNHNKFQAVQNESNKDQVNQIRDSIFVKDEIGFKKVFLREIRFVKAYKNYLEINLAVNSQIIRSTLTDFYQLLPSENFIQTHRSYVVNVDFLENIGGNFVMVSKTEVPLSRGFREPVMKRLKIY
jgi:DNA-binding LytR/AlgR family response regulator